jgi:ABC-type dipeptide/oligopeptide/nickel transport system ATPase component
MGTNEDHIAKLAIRNFQSLENVTLDLGRFTAIVGQSNVGKSAVVRALRQLARNGSSTGLVRQGSKGLQVVALFGDSSVLTTKRGPKESEFQFIPQGQPGQAQSWAKMGINVPDEVAKFWRIPETTDVGDVTFSTQHDAPFMLASPGSAVAKAIGELTNVSILMGAVREANRRRTAEANEERVRAREVAECVAELKAMSNLPQRKALLEQAAAHIAAADAAQNAGQDIVLLSMARKNALEAKQAAEAAVKDVAGWVELVDAAEQIASQWSSLESLAAERKKAQQNVAALTELAGQQEQGAVMFEQQAHDVLVLAGECPTCGQAVTE